MQYQRDRDPRERLFYPLTACLTAGPARSVAGRVPSADSGSGGKQFDDPGCRCRHRARAAAAHRLHAPRRGRRRPPQASLLRHGRRAGDDPAVRRSRLPRRPRPSRGSASAPHRACYGLAHQPAALWAKDSGLLVAGLTHSDDSQPQCPSGDAGRSVSYTPRVLARVSRLAIHVALTAVELVLAHILGTWMSGTAPLLAT